MTEDEILNYHDPCIPYIDMSGWFDVDLMEDDYKGKRRALDVMEALENWNPNLCYTLMEGLADGISVKRTFDTLREYQRRLRILDCLTMSIERLHETRAIDDTEYVRLLEGNTWANADRTKERIDLISPADEFVQRSIRISEGISRSHSRRIHPPLLNKPIEEAPVKTIPVKTRGGQAPDDMFHGVRMTMFRHDTAYRVDHDDHTSWVDETGDEKWRWFHDFNMIMERQSMKAFTVPNKGGYKKTLLYIERQLRKNGIRTMLFDDLKQPAKSH